MHLHRATESMIAQEGGERYRTAVRILSAILLILFLATLGVVIRPFLTPLLWAIILTTTTWPAFERLRRKIPSPLYVAPLLATLLLGVLLLVILVPLPVQLSSEIRELTSRLGATDVAQVRDTLLMVPVVGQILARLVEELVAGPKGVHSLFNTYQTEIIAFASSLGRGIVNAVVSSIAALVGCFILYRHGETLLAQLRTILERIGGSTIAQLIETVHITVRGAAYSVLATAVAQGTLAGVGYYFAGAPVPLLLTLLTIIVSVVPFGSPFVYLPVSAYLLFGSSLPWYYGIGLALWGVLVVSTVDNLLRPLFISQATKLSTVLVFIGVLGGMASFGLLGVFIGPALLAIAQWLWLQLAKPATPPVP